MLCYFYDDVLPQSGGTQIALDSIEIAARFFAEHPEGVHPDLAQGAVLNPFLQQVEGQGRFEELTGEAGDLAIIHPCASYIRCACSVCCFGLHSSSCSHPLVRLRRHDAPIRTESLRPRSLRAVPQCVPQKTDGL